MTARYFKLALVKRGPMCGVKVWRGFPVDPDTGEILTERPILWRCEVNGTPEPIEDVAPWIADGTGEVMRGAEINETEYQFFVKNHQWAVRYAPDDPAAAPRKAVDMNSLPPIKW